MDDTPSTPSIPTAGVTAENPEVVAANAIRNKPFEDAAAAAAKAATTTTPGAKK